MDVIKRKILLETLISRNPDVTYGTITAHTININVFLTQSIDDIGIFTDMPYISATTIQQNLPEFSYDLRPDGRDASYYYNFGNRVTGFTDSKLNAYKTYRRGVPYIQNFDLEIDQYYNYQGILVDGRKKITSVATNASISAVTYVDKANNDSTIGTPAQTTGIQYTTYPITGSTSVFNLFPNLRYVFTSINRENPSAINTTFSYIDEGWNEHNTSLSAITKEEIYFGIVSPPEVQTDVFIERGQVSALERHLRLSEIENVEHLMRYGGGFYNVSKNNL
jgi:hypothetical protein